MKLKRAILFMDKEAPASRRVNSPRIGLAPVIPHFEKRVETASLIYVPRRACAAIPCMPRKNGRNIGLALHQLSKNVVMKQACEK